MRQTYKNANMATGMCAGIAGIISVWTIGITEAQAQIVPDTTLPSRSIVIPQGNTSIINGGTQAGPNLFHSFQNFSVPTGASAFFNNGTNIQNIFSRVTGKSISNIDGLIRANGNANLFLLNPNGIIFGPNASLNIGGSFIGTTASSLNFANGTSFSAINPQSTPLLTISVPVGLQFPGVSGNIVNQSVATIPGQPLPVGLAVSPGQTLALIGGDITMVSGQMNAPGGRIELGSVQGPGQVTLNPTPQGLVLGYSNVQNFGNIQLSQKSGISTISPIQGGDIKVRSRNLTLKENSFISTATLGPGNAGDLTVKVSESVELTGNQSIGFFLDNIFASKGVLTPAKLEILPTGLYAVSLGSGVAGNLRINARNVKLENGAVISSANLSTGLGELGQNLTLSNQKAGGNLIITTPNAGSVVISDAGVIAGTAGTQKAGNIEINTGRLLVDRGGVIATPTFSTGLGGNLTVNAKSVELSGMSSEKFSLFTSLDPTLTQKEEISSGLYTLSFPGATQAGNLTINTGSLLVEKGAVASTSSLSGQGSGDLTVKATDGIKLIGKGGNIQIIKEIFQTQVDPADLRSGLLTSSLIAGKVGNINIETPFLTVKDGATISASTFGGGQGGNVNINATGLVEVIGGGLLTGTTGPKNSGDLSIKADKLVVSQGGVITTLSFASKADEQVGNSGNLKVDARSIILEGIANQPIELRNAEELNNSGLGTEQYPPLPIPSSLLTVAFGAGNAGDIQINTNNLTISNGAAISTSTFGNGTGGKLNIIVPTGAVEITGNSSFEEPLKQVFSSEIEGNFTTRKIANFRNGVFTLSVSQEEKAGNAGDLTIETKKLILSNGGGIYTTTLGSGKGGNVIIKASDSVQLNDAGVLTGNGTNPQAGKAGNLRIETRELIAKNGGLVQTSTLSKGDGGDLSVTAESIELQGTSASGITSGLFTLTFAQGKAGDLTIETKNLMAINSGNIATSTFASGSGGNLTINAHDGTIEVQGISQNTNSISSGLRANALKQVPGYVQIKEELRPDPEKEGTGIPGNINIQTGTLIVRDQALVGVEVPNNQKAGTINIDANSIVAIDRGIITAANEAQGKGGQINGNIDALFQDPSSTITARSNNANQQGDVEIRINNNNNPSQGLVDLSRGIFSSSDEINLACANDQRETGGEFVITGRGGLPPNPSEPLSSDINTISVGTPPTAIDKNHNMATIQSIPNPSSLPPPAQGWFVKPNGDLVLTAWAPTFAPQTPRLPRGYCHER